MVSGKAAAASSRSQTLEIWGIANKRIKIRSSFDSAGTKNFLVDRTTYYLTPTSSRSTGMQAPGSDLRPLHLLNSRATLLGLGPANGPAWKQSPALPANGGDAISAPSAAGASRSQGCARRPRARTEGPLPRSRLSRFKKEIGRQTLTPAVTRSQGSNQGYGSRGFQNKDKGTRETSRGVSRAERVNALPSAQRRLELMN